MWSEKNYTEDNLHKSLMSIKWNVGEEENYKEEWEKKNYTLQLLLATQL